MTKIHPTAIVESGVELGDDVVLEAYAVVKGNVKLGKGVVIKSHAYLDGHTTIGDQTVVYPGAVIGTKTQDLKYAGETTYVSIGKHCEIRECTTINSSCGENSRVTIGDHCMIMAYCHVAHNCHIGHHVVMSNNAILAGHVIVQDYAIIGGMTPIHQHVRIGSHAMVGGMSRVTNDVPPYTVGGGIPYKFGGINRVGLKRREFSFDVQQNLARCFRLVYASGLHLEEALVRIEQECDLLPEVVHWIEFCRSSLRGLLGLQGVAQGRQDEMALDEELEQEQVVGSIR